MTPPRVSIVMAVYNGAPYVPAAIDSVLKQTFTDFEFIVIDDGSTDETWQILTGFADQDPRLVIRRNQPNQGVVLALNRGLDLAQGEWIARQDADDISLAERIASQVRFLEAHPEHGCVGVAVQKIDEKGAPLGLAFNLQDNAAIQNALLDDMCICGPTILVRRESFQKAGFFFSEGLNASEDYDLCLRLAEVARLDVLGEPLYLYRQHAQSASRTQEQRQADHKAIALERAIHRRFGPDAPVERFSNVGRDYLRAAIIAVSQKDMGAARKGLENALRVYPPILETDQPVERLARAYTPGETVDAALEYTTNLFEYLLPRNRRLQKVEARILSDLHMGEVFREPFQAERVRAHLWEGIRNHPAWLLNRGVASILVKAIVRSTHP